MKTQQDNKKHIKRVLHKRTWWGEWLICFNTERGTYDAVFLSKDDRLVVYPTPVLKKHVNEDVLSTMSVGTIDRFLHFESSDGTKFFAIASPYEKTLQPERALWIRMQLDRIGLTTECHKFVNELMCLEFGKCQGDTDV